MPPGAKQLQDLAFLALVHRVRDGITAIDGVECSGDHLSKLQHDFWSSSPPSAGGRNLRRALKQFPVARNPHASVVERRGPEQLRRHASNSDLAFMLCLLRNMASTTAFRQPNRAGRWVLSTHSSRWSTEGPVIPEPSHGHDGRGCYEPQTHERLPTWHPSVTKPASVRSGCRIALRRVRQRTVRAAPSAAFPTGATRGCEWRHGRCARQAAR